jgi:uncharacterized protein
MAPRFLDTNVLLRYFTRDDEAKARQSLALLLRVERGDERVSTSPLVIFETIFTLQRFYQVPREQIRDLVWSVIALRGVQLPDKAIYEHAFMLYVNRNIAFADAFNAAYMQARGLREIYSWDTDFDTIPGLARVEPHEMPQPDTIAGS